MADPIPDATLDSYLRLYDLWQQEGNFGAAREVAELVPTLIAAYREKVAENKRLLIVSQGMYADAAARAEKAKADLAALRADTERLVRNARLQAHYKSCDFHERGDCCSHYTNEELTEAGVFDWKKDEVEPS